MRGDFPFSEAVVADFFGGHFLRPDIFNPHKVLIRLHIRTVIERGTPASPCLKATEKKKTEKNLDLPRSNLLKLSFLREKKE